MNVLNRNSTVKSTFSSNSWSDFAGRAKAFQEMEFHPKVKPKIVQEPYSRFNTYHEEISEYSKIPTQIINRNYTNPKTMKKFVQACLFFIFTCSFLYVNAANTAGNTDFISDKFEINDDGNSLVFPFNTTDTLLVDSTLVVCLDTSGLPGNLMSIAPCVPAPVFGSFGTVDLSMGTFQYTAGSASGIDNFCVEICDNLANCLDFTINLTVNPLMEIVEPCDCDDPLNYDLNGIEYFHEEFTLTGAPGDVYEIDFANSMGIFDDSGMALVAPQVFTEISPGVFQIELFVQLDVMFEVTASNGAGLEANASSICDLACNIAPSISCPPLETDMETAITKCPTLSDANVGDVLTVANCDNPVAANGEVVVSDMNCITYTPNEGFAGLDSFCLIVCDQIGACDSTVVTVCVTPDPELEGDQFVCQGETVTYTLTNYNPDNVYDFGVSSNGSIVNEFEDEVTIEWNDNGGSTNQISVFVSSNGATCEGVGFYNVFIEDDIALSCNGNLNISLNGSCEAEITADVILEATAYEDDSYTIVITDENGGVLPTNIVDASYIGQTLEVQVIHDCSNNVCWGNIFIEDKIAPVIICPESDTLTCDEYAVFNIPTPALENGGCGDESVATESVETIGECDDEFAYILTITQVATDQSGNSSDPCIYQIFVEKESIDSLELPVNYDGLGDNPEPLSCSGNFPLDDDGNPSPTFTGEPGGLGACLNVSYTYNDVIVPLCETTCSVDEASYKVLRTWTIIEWCTGTIIEHLQVIKVVDIVAPVIAPIADITIGTDIWGCGATIELPDVMATDNCSSDESINYTFSGAIGTQVGNTFVLADPAVTTPGMPIVITVTAEDCCGNSSSRDFNVTVVDLVPPVVVAETKHNIALTLNGVAKLFAEDLDDGSHDGCGPIGFFAKRMDNGGGCQSFDEFPPAGNDNAQYNEAVFFCCNDVSDQPVMVQFQVCDDANQDGIIGNTGDNCNLAMIEVYVQDKLAPAILCPGNLTISCSTLTGLDLSDESLLNSLFGSATGAGTCDVSITQSAVASELCGDGVLFRNFTATNDGGAVSCQQVITVQATTAEKLTCNRISFTDLSNAVYNWCAVNDNVNDNDDDLPAITIDCDADLAVPELDIDINGLCTEAGVQITVDTFNFAGGACKKFLVHYEVIDQCVFDENYVDPVTGEISPFDTDNGYFEFYLEINAFDNEAPQLDCETQTLIATNCFGYENSITIGGTDNCTDEAFFSRTWRLDVDNNGVFDFPAVGFATTNSITAAQLGLGAIPLGTHAVQWIVNDGCGNEATCSQLIVITGEEKAPTPYCYNGLSVAVMPSTGTVALWANDFDAGSFDNCDNPIVASMIPETDVDGLDAQAAYNLSFSHPNVTQQANGDYGFEFDCSYIPNGVSVVLKVRIYITDEFGNFDYCTAELRIDDNFDACEDGATGTLTLDGVVKTETGEYIELVDVKLQANYPEFPKSQVTIDDGTYAFDNLHAAVDYAVEPTRNDDHLNGVSTLDIIMIQKHILGLDPLTSPYSMIAADVNNDCQVTGADLVQMRRLILGKYANDQFPTNQSWKFVDNNFQFQASVQPCEYLESTEFINMSNSATGDFTGVKIGDINKSAQSNLTNNNTETRTAKNVDFYITDQQVGAGKFVYMDVTADNFNSVYGFQMSIDLGNLQMQKINAGAINLTDENIAFVGDQLLISYAEGRPLFANATDVLFTIVAQADRSTSLVQEIGKGEKLEAEVYVSAELEIANLNLKYRNQDQTITENDFALLQNEPNPFKDQTMITFTLPATAEATLTVYDAGGKVMYKQTNGFAKGINTITLTRNDIPTTGILFYELVSGDFTATKKMMVIE